MISQIPLDVWLALIAALIVLVTGGPMTAFVAAYVALVAYIIIRTFYEA